jgi:hypothetical protein
MTGIHRDTVMRLGMKVGTACQQILSEKMNSLDSTRRVIGENARADATRLYRLPSRERQEVVGRSGLRKSRSCRFCGEAESGDKMVVELAWQHGVCEPTFYQSQGLTLTDEFAREGLTIAVEHRMGARTVYGYHEVRTWRRGGNFYFISPDRFPGVACGDEGTR